MKIRLLNSDGYAGMDGVKFPVEVSSRGNGGERYVHERELKRIGCDMDCFEDPDDPVWPFGPESWEAAE